MSTHVFLTCEHCHRKLRIRSEYLGRRVACNFCHHRFVALENQGAEPAAALEWGEREAVETTDDTALRDEARRSRDALQRLKSAYDSLRSKSLKSDERRKALQHRVEDLEAALNQSALQLRTSLSEVATLQERLVEMEPLQLEVGGLRTQLSRTVELEAEVQSLKVHVQRRQIEIEESEARGTRLQLQIEQRSLCQTRTDQERQAALAEVQALTGELKALRAERDQLVDLLRQTRQEFDSAHEEATATEHAHAEEVQRLREDLNASRLDVEQSHLRHAESVASLQREWQEERAALVAKHETAVQSLEHLQSQLDDSVGQVATLRLELDRLASNHEALQSHANRTAELNRAEIARLTSELAKVDRRDQPGTAPLATLSQRTDTQTLPSAELPPRPRLSPDDDPARFRLALQDWVSQAQRRRDQSTIDLANVERELVSAREQLLLLHRDVALGQWNKDMNRVSFPFDDE